MKKESWFHKILKRLGILIDREFTKNDYKRMCNIALTSPVGCSRKCESCIWNPDR